MKKLIFLVMVASLNAQKVSLTPRFTLEGIEDGPFGWIPVVFIMFTFFTFLGS